MGLCAFFAHSGAMVSPYVAYLAIYVKELPMIIFGVSLLISSFLIFFLPETLGRILPETIEDAENFGEEKSTQQSSIQIVTLSIKKLET